MSFKFDDDDNELELKLGDGSIKQQVPAPLPKKAIKPNGDVLNKLPRPGQTPAANTEEPEETKAPAPKVPAKPKVETTPTLPKTPSKPVSPEPEAVQQETIVTSVEPVVEPEIDSSEEDVPYVDTPAPAYEPRQSTLTSSDVINPKRYENTPVEEVFQSNVILTPAETASTFKKKNPFDGDRKKILRIRVIAGCVAGLVMLAGVWSFVPKPAFKDDTASVNAALTFTAKYDSIRMASESYALRFATDFLDRTETTEQYRKETMATYMSPETLGKVDFSLGTVPSSKSRDGAKIYQQITSGPYVYNVNNITAEAIQAQRVDGYDGFVLSILVSAYVTPYISQSDISNVNGIVPELKPKWVYLSIPVVHNFETKQTTLYGYPSFVTPEITKGLDNYSKPYEDADWGSGDTALSENSVLVAQLETYLSEWAKQSPNDKVSSNLKALLSSDATPRSQQGLAGAYTNLNGSNIVYDVNVKPLGKDVKADAATKREALVTVKWTDNNNNSDANAKQSVYVQQYLIYFKGSSDKWQIIDIKPRYAE